MKLEFIDVTDQFTGGFDVPGGYKFEHWWQQQASRRTPGYRQFKVMNGAEEVARFELDDTAERRTFICSTYPIPLSGPRILEIQFIDVRDMFRGKKIGTRIVLKLEQEYPELQLLALAEASEGFWSSLGWTQILPDERERREMYLSPFYE